MKVLRPKPNQPKRQKSIRKARLNLDPLEDRWLLNAAIINVDAAAGLHGINPDIYGVNFGGTATLTDLNVPINREGGTPTSTYNWQVNASNRGNDFFYESLSDGSATPGALNDAFINSTKQGLAQPMITVPTLNWVANLGAGGASLDSFSVAKYGAQTATDPNWPDAGNGILQATGQFVTGNDPNDAFVPNSTNLQQGWINHLIATFGTAAQGGVQFYELDNEPGIWHSQHRDVHPVGATYDEVLNDMISYASVIRAADPSALIMGPEEWNFAGYLISGYDLQYDAAHNFGGVYPDRLAHNNMEYIPYLLDQIRQHDVITGTRLLDYLSVHYYPQGDAKGDQEFSNDVSTATQLLRNVSTRSLWDPNYTDQSYVNTQVDLIPRLQGWVNTYYPGTKVAITEYNWGAEDHMNGATVEADVLGIFGRENLDLADRWEAPVAGTPTYNAFKMYRNYDGQLSTFGDTSVSTIAPSPDDVSAFGALRSKDGALTVMVVNKDLVDPNNLNGTDPITVNLSNFNSNGTVQFYLLSAPNPNDLTNSSIFRLADGVVAGNSFTISIPRQSILLAVVIPSNGGNPSPKIGIVGRVKESGAWWVGQSTGNSLSTTYWGSWNPGVTWVDVHTGDFIGNGKTDIVGRVLETGQWWMAQSTGSSFVNSLWATWNPNVTWADVQVGDFNGDGKPDIIGRYLEGGSWWVGTSTGSSFSTTLWGAWNPAVTWVDVNVGDFNGDKKADLVGRYLQTGQWWVSLSSGSSLSNSLWATWNPNVTWVDVKVGDFNGDGMTDITGRYLEAGSWWTGLSTGSSFTTSLWAQWNANVTWVDVKVGDFNGDGKDDLTARYLEGGTWWTATSTGSSFNTTMWASWSPAIQWVDILVGDFNGDGKADIIGRYLQGGSWWAGVSNGGGYSTSLWASWSPNVTWTDVSVGRFS
jgi:hypothetical protein